MGRIIQLRDADANDSSKDFTVPTGHVYKLLSGNLNIVTQVTVGNRIFELRVLNGVTVVFASILGAVVANGVTTIVNILPAVTKNTTETNGVWLLPIPTEMYIPSGYIIRILDSAAIAPTTDDVTVNLTVIDYLEGALD